MTKSQEADKINKRIIADALQGIDTSSEACLPGMSASQIYWDHYIVAKEVTHG